MTKDKYTQLVRELWPEMTMESWMPKAYMAGLVSIIIPTYNRASLLTQTLRSVVRQTYRPIEVLIVDDGSTDNTLEVVQQWKRTVDDGLCVRFMRQPNNGANAARNRGLMACSGEYIQFLDSDDILHPQQVQLLYTVISGGLSGNSQPCDLVFSPQTKGEQLPTSFRNPVKIGRVSATEIDTIENNPMVIPKNRGSVLFQRRLCLEAGPWDESLIRWQDMEYMFRVTALRPSYRRVDEELYFLRQHDQGRIQDLYQKEQGIDGGLDALERVERILSKSGQQDREAKYCAARYYLGLAKLAMGMGDEMGVWKGLQGALRQAPNVLFHFKIYAIWYMYKYSGALFTLEALNLYSRIRSNQ